MSPIHFYSQTFLRLLDFLRSGVVNGILRGVSVPRHLLNDTNILYITNSMYSILGSHNWSVAHPFLQPNVPPFWGFRAWFSAFWGGKRNTSWGVGTKAPPEWYKHLIYISCNVYKHLKVIIEVSLINFYSLTILRFGVSELDFLRSGAVNGLVRGVSVWRHFLNDTHLFHTSHVMCKNIWKT